MAKGLVTDRYAYKRMAFARKKPRYGWMNIQNMPKDFPMDQDGNLTPLGEQRLRLTEAAHANAGTRGTTMYRGVRIPRISMAVASSIQRGILVSPQIREQERQEKLQHTAELIQSLRSRGYGGATAQRRALGSRYEEGRY